MDLDRISIELTNQCSKGCWFCYNHSGPEGATRWDADELVEFVCDCADNGIKAVSFGGGEPLQYADLFRVLEALQGVLFRSLTTNGLLLDEQTTDQLIEAAPDKVHVSIHFPHHLPEVERVIRAVTGLAERGVRSGVNLLIRRSQLDVARKAASRLRDAGISNERIVYLPMRGQDTPTPNEIAEIAGKIPFQSMTCLSRCQASPRFCSISWDQQVAWCSYTQTKNQLKELSFQALSNALVDLGLEFCGNKNPLVRLS